MKATRKSQVLEKTNIACLYRSSDWGVFYGIFSRKADQVKKSLKTTDKELARRRLEALRQKVVRLNTKAGRAILFGDFAKRWVDTSRKDHHDLTAQTCYLVSVNTNYTNTLCLCPGIT